jgi:hypothetical protein
MGKRRPTPKMEDLLLGQTRSEKAAGQESSQRPLAKEEQKKQKEKDQMKRRLPRRATYDLPPGMKERIVEIANEHGTTASQVAAFLLHGGIKQIEAGMINLDRYKEPSTSIRWEYNLRIDD